MSDKRKEKRWKRENRAKPKYVKVKGKFNQEVKEIEQRGRNTF